MGKYNFYLLFSLITLLIFNTQDVHAMHKNLTDEEILKAANFFWSKIQTRGTFFIKEEGIFESWNQIKANEYKNRSLKCRLIDKLFFLFDGPVDLSEINEDDKEKIANVYLDASLEYFNFILKLPSQGSPIMGIASLIIRQIKARNHLEAFEPYLSQCSDELDTRSRSRLHKYIKERLKELQIEIEWSAASLEELVNAVIDNLQMTADNRSNTNAATATHEFDFNNDVTEDQDITTEIIEIVAMDLVLKIMNVQERSNTSITQEELLSLLKRNGITLDWGDDILEKLMKRVEGILKDIPAPIIEREEATPLVRHNFTSTTEEQYEDYLGPQPSQGNEVIVMEACIIS